MGDGSYRSMVLGGAPIVRTAAAWAICVLVLAGCESVSESMREIGIWPFDADETSEAAAAPEGGDEPVTAAVGDEVALDAALITKVQKQLTDLGYEPGSIDGAMGPKTRAAIRRYQVVVGLPVNGRISEAFLARLDGPSDVDGPSDADGPSQVEAEVELGDKAEAAAATNSAAVLDPAPAYEVGSRYVYADGDVRTVLDVDGEQVYWNSRKSGHFVAYGNFLIPRLSWVSSETSGKRTVDAAPGDFWPKETGAEMTLSATTLVEHRNRPDSRSELKETWRCRLEGESQLSVRAGVFQTRQFVCDGVSEPGGARLRRIWHYAPDIRHYVLFEEIDGSRRLRRRNELLAIVPSTGEWPPAARAGLGWALEHALETAAPGEETSWTSSAVDTQVTIKPGPQAVAGKKETCRNFVQTWSEPEGARVYPGLSCREEAGQWLIPNLEPGVEVAESGD
jgi:peptidoglycan hydrolase-like protein with peptidoglycan-binding domain